MSFFKSFAISLLRCSALMALLLLPVDGAMAKNFVLTLDAGHGGHDYGAIGATTNEKTITLQVVTKLGKLINENLPDVDVVYTRSTDVFIPLDERASIANKANSDLFMSVHINSVDKRNANRKTIEGCQVYTLGLHKTAENLAVAKRENSVMELEADHTEKYAGFDPNSLESDIVFELTQNKRLEQSIEFADAAHNELVKTAGRQPKGVRQAGFWVLWATSMPSVLVELDFICNPKSEQFLSSDAGQEQMVAALYNALCAYINTYGSQITGRTLPVAHALEVSTSNSAPTAALPAAKAVAHSDIKEIADDSGTEQYFVQILASVSPLSASSSELKGMADVQYYYDGGLYKYVVGAAATVSEAGTLLKQVRATFPQSFIIKMINGKRVDFIKP